MGLKSQVRVRFQGDVLLVHGIPWRFSDDFHWVFTRISPGFAEDVLAFSWWEMAPVQVGASLIECLDVWKSPKIPNFFFGIIFFGFFSKWHAIDIINPLWFTGEWERIIYNRCSAWLLSVLFWFIVCHQHQWSLATNNNYDNNNMRCSLSKTIL